MLQIFFKSQLTWLEDKSCLCSSVCVRYTVWTEGLGAKGFLSQGDVW